MKKVNKKKELGFTLIELMIVVAIIGILAALALPKFASLVEKSREAATKGNLNALVGAVSIYYGDNEGVFPEIINCGLNYTFSNYLESIPPVKATHSGVGTGITDSPSGTNVMHSQAAILAKGSGWRYNALDGHMYVNSSITDSKKMPYSTYGY